MSAGVTRARTLVLALAFFLTLCVGAAMGVAVLASEGGKITETQRAVATVLLGSILNSLSEGADRPTGSALAQQAVTIGMALSDDLQGGWSVRVQDGAGHVLAASPNGDPPSSRDIVARVRLPDTASAGLELTVSVHDGTEATLRTVFLNLLAGLAIGLCAGLELLRWLFARGVDRPMDIITATALAGVRSDYRRSPGLGDASELGALQTALARFLSYVTLRRQEVTLMLQDARRDTYDPQLVARAGGWLDRLDALARFATDELAMMPIQGDPGLQRLLCFLAAVLLGLHAGQLATPFVLAATLAAVMGAGRLGAAVPRWLGRRGAILSATSVGIVGLTIWPHASASGSLVVGAAVLGLVLRAATAGDGEPVGKSGLQLDAGAFSGIAAGLAVATTILLMVPESVAGEHDHLWPWGLALFAFVAMAALQENLAPPARSVLPRFADLAGVLLNVRLCGVVVLLAMPAAGCAGMLLRAALGAAEGDFALLATASGVWLAAVIARGFHRVPGLDFVSRVGAGALLLGAVDLPAELDSWHFVVAGMLVGLLWHGASAALYDVISAQAAGVAEQASLRVAYVLRAVAIVVAIVVVSPMQPTGIALLIGAVLAAFFQWRQARSRGRPPSIPASAPVA